MIKFLVMDASGRYTWGLFSGNRYWIGAMDQCKEMENNYINYLLHTTDNNNNDKEIIKKNYSSIPPFHVSVNSVNLQIFMMLDESNPVSDYDYYIINYIIINTIKFFMSFFIFQLSEIN